MQPSSQAAPSGGDSSCRPAPAALLAEASGYYLAEATTNAKGAADQLEALAGHRGLSREQAHLLRSAAAAAGMAAEVRALRAVRVASGHAAEHLEPQSLQAGFVRHAHGLSVLDRGVEDGLAFLVPVDVDAEALRVKLGVKPHSLGRLQAVSGEELLNPSADRLLHGLSIGP